MSINYDKGCSRLNWLFFSYHVSNPNYDKMLKFARARNNNYFRVNLHLPSHQVQSTLHLKPMVVVTQSLFSNGLLPIAVTLIFFHSNQWKMQTLVKKFSTWMGQKVLEKQMLNLCFFKTFSPVSNTLLKLSQSTVWVKDPLHPNTLSPSNKNDVSNVASKTVTVWRNMFPKFNIYSFMFMRIFDSSLQPFYTNCTLPPSLVK